MTAVYAKSTTGTTAAAHTVRLHAVRCDTRQIEQMTESLSCVTVSIVKGVSFDCFISESVKEERARDHQTRVSVNYSSSSSTGRALTNTSSAGVWLHRITGYLRAQMPSHSHSAVCLTLVVSSYFALDSILSVTLLTFYTHRT